MQKAAKDEILRAQSRPVFENHQIGLELYPSIWGFLVNFRVGLKIKPPELNGFQAVS
jgi:hypothetical protein